MKYIFDHIRAGNKEIDRKTVEALADEIIYELMLDKNSFAGMADPRPVGEYLFRHSVNVCVLSLIVAKSLFASKDKLKELAVGALLHDIGKAFVPEEILHKNGPLTDEETEKVQEHTKFGYTLLSKYDTISLFTRHIPYQHHERADGSGYPRGLTNNQMVDYAKIVNLVDSFDAMTSDRPYRDGMKTSVAIKELFKMRKAFDPKIMKIFLRSVAPFPMGEKVRLSNGDVGFVIKINHREVDRPVISVTRDGAKHRVDLSVEKRLDIEAV